MNKNNLIDNETSGHNSDSTIQSEIEYIVTAAVAKKLLMTLSSEVFKLQDVNFQVDFYNEDNAVYGEIYAGIENLKPGQTRKIGMDILKLLTIEKLLNKPINKYLAFVDEAIEKKFSTSNSWYTKSILAFNIKTIYIPLTECERQLIKKAKKRQYR
jgi:hypothetical protein